MTPKTKAWIMLACTAISSGTAAAGAAYAGGCKLGWAIATGCGTAATAVYHALQSSPNDSTTTTNKPT